VIKPSTKTLEKRERDRKAQEEYWKKHKICEVCGLEKAVEVHEIIFRSQGGKCEKDNMISLCRNCHNQAHYKQLPYLHRERLWKIKGLNPEEMWEKLRKIRKGGI